MKTVQRYIDAIRETVDFWVGENAADNDTLLDRADGGDLWFHVSGRPSCHVIARLGLDREYTKKEIHKIAIQGGVICKQYSKYRSERAVPIVYTRREQVTKTRVVGKVEVDTYYSITI
jgi:predicted ribosome quality control (RQC) complex YloA/Tae2 family protein